MPDQNLPSELDGVPIDVRQATPEKRKELANPSGYATDMRLAPDLGGTPPAVTEYVIPL